MFTDISGKIFNLFGEGRVSSIYYTSQLIPTYIGDSIAWELELLVEDSFCVR